MVRSARVGVQRTFLKHTLPEMVGDNRDWCCTRVLRDRANNEQASYSEFHAARCLFVLRVRTGTSVCADVDITCRCQHRPSRNPAKLHHTRPPTNIPLLTASSPPPPPTHNQLIDTPFPKGPASEPITPLSQQSTAKQPVRILRSQPSSNATSTPRNALSSIATPSFLHHQTCHQSQPPVHTPSTWPRSRAATAIPGSAEMRHRHVRETISAK